MIKLKSLEYFLINVSFFLLGILLYYNLRLKYLFLISFLAIFPKIRIPITFLTIGLLAIYIRLANQNTPSVEQMKSAEVFGKIERLYFKNGDLRAVVKTKGEYEKLIASFRGVSEIKIGDELLLKGFIVPLPKKPYPTFYDVESKNKFNKIAGYFSVKKFEIISTSFSMVDLLRRHVLKILDKFEKDGARGIALALIMGDKGLISKEDYNNFKKAGIAHILAISGLHMSIVCIFVFTVVFRILAFTTLYKYCNTRKIAGGVGVFFGLIYLLLAGVPISGLRSFLMVILLFINIFFLRGGGGVRSLAISLFIILCFWGEEVFFPSFQLSFVSVLCLLKMSNFKIGRRFAIGGKIINSIFTTAFSSVLVSILTIPFAIHHFSYIHFYGAISNIVAIPILAIFIMPIAILSLTGFAPFIFLFEWGIDLLFIVANAISNLPFSSIFMPHLNGSLLAIYSFCLIFLMCFEQKVVRLVGFLGILFISIFYFLTAKSPVLVANEDYLVMKDGERYVSLSYIPRGFLREVWEEKLNSKITSISNTNLVELVCDESFCYSIKNKFTVLFEEVENIPYCTGGSLIKLIGVNSNLECEFQNTFNLDNLKYTPILIY